MRRSVNLGMIELAVFDIDGTLTSHHSIWRYLHERLGLWDGNAERYQRAYRKGEISYEEFCRLDAALWRGLPETDLRNLADSIRYNRGVTEALARLRAAGLRLAAVSTGLSLLVDRIIEELVIEFSLCNRLLTNDGRLTGEVELRVTDEDKGRAVVELAERSGVEPRSMAAVGDSITDLSMFRQVGLSIAYGNVGSEVLRAADYHVEEGDFGPVADIILGKPNNGG